ncbi:hypothetical protein [Bradyrhizobium lablabi]|uniref:hypothetical protein n=1 Tax=Bradyrhizobium lablabi TaxID=722472 RepID=UPI0012E3EA49|nr:hypothetical protein [Bradyrhizobium lablabi]
MELAGELHAGHAQGLAYGPDPTFGGMRNGSAGLSPSSRSSNRCGREVLTSFLILQTDFLGLSSAYDLILIHEIRIQ